MTLETEKVRFMKIFSNVPDKIRNEDIIVVIDDKPYTWNAAYLEIDNGSELGTKILKELKVMRII